MYHSRNSGCHFILPNFIHVGQRNKIPSQNVSVRVFINRPNIQLSDPSLQLSTETCLKRPCVTKKKVCQDRWSFQTGSTCMDFNSRKTFWPMAKWFSRQDGLSSGSFQTGFRNKLEAVKCVRSEKTSLKREVFLQWTYYLYKILLP